MSLFKTQMFIEDASPALDFASEADGFGPSYGNRIASERLFREAWNLHRREPDVASADGCACAPER